MRRRIPRLSDRRSDALKSLPPRLGSSWGTVLGGMQFGYGPTPWAPGSQLDYERRVGNVRDNSIVSICLDWKRKRVTLGTLQIGIEDGEGNFTPSQKHPLLALLRRPNPVWTWGAMLGGISDSIDIDGNAYLVKARDGNGFGRVRELYWIPNHQMQLKYATRSDAPHPIESYRYINGDYYKDYKPADVIHLRNGIDPLNMAMGLGVIKRQIRSIDATNSGDTYTASVLRNRHSGKVMAPKQPIGSLGGGQLTPDEQQLLAEKERIDRHTRGESSGDMVAITTPVDLLDAGMGPEEIMLDRILDRPECKIVASTGLNSIVLGLPGSHDTRTYNNYAEARRDAIESGIIPTQDLVAEAITLQLVFYCDETGRLVSEWGDAEGVYLRWDRSQVAALREDANERANRTVALFTSGALPRDRSLSEGGFDPVGGEEGELYASQPLPAEVEASETAHERAMELATAQDSQDDAGEQDMGEMMGEQGQEQNNE